MSLKWTQHERADYKRPNEKAARIIALYLLRQSGDLNIENKSAFARMLGISRHTLDRDLTTLDAATELAEQYRKKMLESE